MFIYLLGWNGSSVIRPLYANCSEDDDDNDEDDDKLHKGLIHQINQQYAFFQIK